VVVEDGVLVSAEFVALAKKDPGKYSFGSGSSSSRMAGELLQQMADKSQRHVSALTNLLQDAGVNSTSRH
jgi:tripartite-type tricarboxylate transporter receptor subunit TctC